MSRDPLEPPRPLGELVELTGGNQDMPQILQNMVDLARRTVPASTRSGYHVDPPRQGRDGSQHRRYADVLDELQRAWRVYGTTGHGMTVTTDSPWTSVDVHMSA